MAKNRKPVMKKAAQRLSIILGIVIVILLAIMIALPFVANYFDGVLRDFIGTSSSDQSSDVGEDGEESSSKMAYNNPAYDSFDELYAAEQDYMREAAGEGFVLLKNDGGLPVETSAGNKAKIAFFSQSSVDFVIGGTGSGTSTSDVTLKQAFEDCDFDVNTDLWNFYLNSGYSRGAVTLFGCSWAINEVPLNVLEKGVDLDSISSATTAVFIMSRVGGESHDEARYMGSYATTDEDKDKSYLEPDSVELGIIDYLNSKFDNVILVVNTNNMMELGWTEEYDHIKSIIWAPGGGDQSAYALADIISGNTNPSGHLVDTLAYDAFSSPAMQNMGDFQYQNNGSDVKYYGVSYDEGIYVGYKYYETRYYDSVLGQGNATKAVSTDIYKSSGSSWNYSDEVQYPFGYGKSYTTFEWSSFDVSYDSDSDEFTVSVTVTNTGNYDGKDVVQVYLNAPYTSYDKTNIIEKSVAELVGFGKTDILEKNGGSQTLQIKVSRADFASYDDVGAKTYILEDGDYLLTAAKDSNSAVNNFLAYEKGTNKATLNESIMTGEGDSAFVYDYSFKSGQGTMDSTTYATSKAGAEITNRFETEAASTASTVTSNCNFIDRSAYLSRQDWDGTWPETHGKQDGSTSSHDEVGGLMYKQSISDALYSKLQEKGTASAANSPVEDSSITAEMAGSYGLDNTDELQLIDYRGEAYEDADWDALISVMTTSEMGKIINLSGYKTAVAESIGKPETTELDGPAGLNGMVSQTSYSIAYCTEVCIASTWNTRVAYAHGYYVGQDGLTFDDKVNGWYAPAMNIHRTPFAGRNFEYYSEDGYISGIMASETVKAAANQGMYAFAKHFALNEQETYRDSNGICSWVNEQAMRELYLRPFRMISEAGTAEVSYFERNEDGSYVYDWAGNQVMATAEIPVMQGVMTSFNRVGATWAGGSYQLIQEILRDEWGFNGFIITDYTQGATSYMHTEQMLRAGADAELTQYGSNFKLSGDTATANTYYTKKALSHILYTVVNSNAMNSPVYVAFAYYIYVEIALEVVFAAGIIVCIAFIIKKWRKYSKAKHASTTTA
ncbi:MAG: glycoside hydrolase family 3 C-terminal domain-containing protein [Clostridia bacterium]|nr:glycoside hydrolase family 3 C-terminal domain-containing protein [Clostridia bacterium]